jgi:hypothetical protein
VPGGSDYIRFFGPGTRDSLHIHIDGSPAARDQRRYSVVATRGRQHVKRTLAPDADGDAGFTVPDRPQLDHVTLIVTNFLEAAGDLHFTCDAEEVGWPAPILLTDLECVPNPFHQAGHDHLAAQGGGVLVLTFDLSPSRAAKLQRLGFSPARHDHCSVPDGHDPPLLELPAHGQPRRRDPVDFNLGLHTLRVLQDRSRGDRFDRPGGWYRSACGCRSAGFYGASGG